MEVGEATIVDLAVSVEHTEVLRGLGYGRNGAPREDVALRLDALWDVANGLLAPRGAYSLITGETANAAGMPEATDLVGAAVCTIGSALEEEAGRRSDAGRVLDALLLDTFGSTAAEAAARALDRTLCGAAAKDGLKAGGRISPGYGKWHVRCQQELLAHLPAAELGIALTEGMMMVPAKSVSFAVRLEPGGGPGKPRRMCEECDFVDCPYRRHS